MVPIIGQLKVHSNVVLLGVFCERGCGQCGVGLVILKQESSHVPSAETALQKISPQKCSGVKNAGFLLFKLKIKQITEFVLFVEEKCLT